MRVPPTYSTIWTARLKSWAVESLLDGRIWHEIDRQTDRQDVKHVNTAWFAVSKPAEFCFIPLTQTVQNPNGTDYLYLGAVEFFGTFSESIQFPLCFAQSTDFSLASTRPLWTQSNNRLPAPGPDPDRCGRSKSRPGFLIVSFSSLCFEIHRRNGDKESFVESGKPSAFVFEGGMPDTPNPERMRDSA
jgi:hypothetical protein